MQLQRPLWAVLLCCLPALTSAQSGKILESRTVYSRILSKNVEYSVCLPADYEHSERSYPVLYLLHGYSDDETGWTQFGEVKKITDASTGDVDVTPMIIAMPDAGVTWYINSYDGKTRYEDFFIEEFIPHIESTYRARGERQYRAVAGLSMGGHGTLVYAMKHPQLFVAAAPLSAAVWDEEYIVTTAADEWDPWFGEIFGSDLEGEERLTDHLRQNIPAYLVRNQDADALRSVRWYIDCGDDDFLINGNMALTKVMNDREIPHEFRVRDGAHNWTYWREALPEVLRFVSVSFHK